MEIETNLEVVIRRGADPADQAEAKAHSNSILECGIAMPLSKRNHDCALQNKGNLMCSQKICQRVFVILSPELKNEILGGVYPAGGGAQDDSSRGAKNDGL